MKCKFDCEQEWPIVVLTHISCELIIITRLEANKGKPQFECTIDIKYVLWVLDFTMDTPHSKAITCSLFFNSASLA